MKRNSIMGVGVALCIPAMAWPLVQQTSTLQNAPLLNVSVVAMAQEGQGRPRDGREGRPPGGPGMGGGFGGGFRGPGGPFRRSEKMQLGRFVREVGELEKAKKTPLNKKQAQKIVATIAPWRKKATMNDTDAKKLYTALRDTLTATQKKALDQRRPFGPDGPMGGPMGGAPDGRGFGRGPRDEQGERPNGPPPGGRNDREDGPGGPGGPPDGRGFGRGPGGFNGRPNGDRPTPPTEAEMKKMGDFMKSFNPFYPITSYKQVKSLPQPMQEGMTRRYKEMQAVLYQLAAKAK